MSKMEYSKYLDKNFPIGSGVTEAACKVIVKQRLCSSGMKWKHRGAEAVLCLRALNWGDENQLKQHSYFPQAFVPFYLQFC